MTVLVVGGTGLLGRQVVAELRAQDRPVRALVRPGSDAGALEAAGVEVVRGDMLEPDSLPAAFAGADAVITSAVGYTKRRKSDSGDTDVAGNRNLAEAAGRAGVRRFVLTGILRSDEARDVPHFWNKVLAEQDLAARSVPYVSLRPGAFFDQVMDLLPGGGARGGRVVSMWPADVTQSWVLSPDVADALVRLVDAPVADGTHVDLGWTRPVSMQEVATLTEQALGRPVRLVKLPWGLVKGVGGLAGRVNDGVGDMVAMMRFFSTGRYVADTGPATELLGGVPTPEEAVRRWADSPPLTR